MYCGKLIVQAVKRICNQRMDRRVRLGVNQGNGEGVYDCTRPSRYPPVCPQDCLRGAAAGCIFHKKNETGTIKNPPEENRRKDVR